MLSIAYLWTKYLKCKGCDKRAQPEQKTRMHLIVSQKMTIQIYNYIDIIYFLSLFLVIATIIVYFHSTK